MLRLPSRFAEVILAFAPVCLQQRTWRHAELLLIGAILAPGKRMVTSLLRIAGNRRLGEHLAGQLTRMRMAGLSR